MGGPIGFAEFAKRLINANKDLKQSIGEKYKDIKSGKHKDGTKPLKFKKADAKTKQHIQLKKEALAKQTKFRISVVISIFVFAFLTLLFFFL